MEDKFKALNCNDDDVIEFGNNTYKISRFKQAISKSMNDFLARQLYNQLNHNGIHINQANSNSWFERGINCKILNLGSQTWKQGKVRFKMSVEFYIEEDIDNINSEDSIIPEPESPLEDLRRTIYEENS